VRLLVFEGNTWSDYKKLRAKDKKLHISLCKIIKELLSSNPTQGIGKPKQLRLNLSGFWSRRISQKRSYYL
jgi:toxin YoeB